MFSEALEAMVTLGTAGVLIVTVAAVLVAETQPVVVFLAST